MKTLKLLNFIVFLLMQITYATSFGETIEIGVVLLPSNELAKSAQELVDQMKTAANKEGFGYNKEFNILHISLYQLNIDKSRLEELKAVVAQIAMSYESIEFGMDNYLIEESANLFWNSSIAKNDAVLRALLREVIKKASPLRHKNPMRQVLDEKNLTKQQAALIKQYGVFWGLEHNFNPHFTMLYNISFDGSINHLLDAFSPVSTKIATEHKFKGTKLAVCKLGYHGNVLEILSTFDLRK